MADRITINFAANIVEVEKGAEKMSASIDDVKAALDDMGQEGQAASAALADGQAAAAAGFEDVETSAASAGEGLGDLGNIGKQVLEGDIGGAAQAALGAVSSLGPAGLIAGTVAAAGIGLITSELKRQQDEADKAQQALVDAYSAAIAEGRAYLDLAQVISGVQDIYGDPEKLKAATAAAARAGVDTATYIRAQAGSYEDLVAVIELARQTEEERSSAGGIKNRADAANRQDELHAISAIIAANESLLSTHVQQRQASEAAVSAVQELKSRESQRAADAISGIDQQGVRLQLLADQLSTLPGAKIDVTVDTASAKRQVEAFIADLKSRRIPIVADVVDRYGRRLP